METTSCVVFQNLLIIFFFSNVISHVSHGAFSERHLDGPVSLTLELISLQIGYVPNKLSLHECLSMFIYAGVSWLFGKIGIWWPLKRSFQIFQLMSCILQSVFCRSGVIWSVKGEWQIHGGWSQQQDPSVAQDFTPATTLNSDIFELYNFL